MILYFRLEIQHAFFRYHIKVYNCALILHQNTIHCLIRQPAQPACLTELSILGIDSSMIVLLSKVVIYQYKIFVSVQSNIRKFTTAWHSSESYIRLTTRRGHMSISRSRLVANTSQQMTKQFFISGNSILKLLDLPMVLLNPIACITHDVFVYCGILVNV